MKKIILLLLLCIPGALASQVKQEYTLEDAWRDANVAPLAEKSETARQRSEWFREARLGMFLHWNPSSVCATEISWSKQFYEDDGEHLETNPRPTIENYRKELDVWYSWFKPQIPGKIYDNLYKSFYPGMFDADSVVMKAKAAGMKYLVMIAKHHDGFCMWDTQYSDFNVMNTPFHRDVLGEIAAACHRHGLRFGVYYSQRDWHHPAYSQERIKEYNEFMRNQLRELLTKYAPVDLVFFDAEKPEENVPNIWETEKMFKEIYSLCPDIIINDRCGIPGDYDTPEQEVGAFQTERAWESCMTFTGCWSWRGFTYPVIPLEKCLENLTGCAGGGGNLLMNVDMMPTGQIDPREGTRLEGIGKWLEINGEAIFGTQAGPLRPQEWGVATSKDDAVYLIIQDCSKFDGVVEIPGKKFRTAEILGGGEVSFESRRGRTSIQVDSLDIAPFTVIKLQR